jgi:hypothetical protein
LLPLSPKRYRLILLGRIDTDNKADVFFGQLFSRLQIETPFHSLVSDDGAAHVDKVFGIVSEDPQHVARVVAFKELLDSLLESGSLGDVVQTEDAKVSAYILYFLLDCRIHG